MPTTLVLGYDGSDTGKKALAHTAELARHLDDGEVFVVSAFEFSIGYVPMGMTDSPLMISAEYDQHVDLVRSACDQQIAEAVKELAGRRRRGLRRRARGQAGGRAARGGAREAGRRHRRRQPRRGRHVGRVPRLHGAQAAAPQRHPRARGAAARQEVARPRPAHGRRRRWRSGASPTRTSSSCSTRPIVGPRVRPAGGLPPHVRLPRVLHRGQPVRRRLAGDGDAAPGRGRPGRGGRAPAAARSSRPRGAR